MTRRLIAILCAVITTYIVAVTLVSQLNIARIVKMGFPVSLGQRFIAAQHDLVSMLDIYLPVIVVALLIAFLFTSLLLLRFFNKPLVLFSLAGFMGLIAVHLILKAVFGVAGIAAARSIIGLLSQGLAGALGGYVYSRIVFDYKNGVEQPSMLPR